MLAASMCRKNSTRGSGGAVAPLASERDKPVIPNAGTALLRRLLFNARFDMAQFSHPFGHY
jgi:hypothetical protein